MLSSIHPLGEAGRGNRYAYTAAAFIAGSAVGGLATAGVVGMTSAALNEVGINPIWLASAITLATVGAAASRRALPSLPRQVDENWLGEFRGCIYGLGFGFQLGAGVMTYIRSVWVWVWLAAIVGVRSLSLAVGLGLVFGLVRGLSILTTRSIRSPEELVAFHRRLANGPRLRRFV